jgi:16S rRNA (cytosine967-C5)-methyltransferase
LRHPPPPSVHALLLCALYRLESREDAHTVVDQAVTAAGALQGGRCKGMVNGVLRNFLRRRADLLAGLPEAARFCHPAWWVDRLRRAYPEDWPAIVAAGNRPPPMALRVNARRVGREEYRRRLAEAGISAAARGECGLLLEKPVPVECLPGFFAGEVSVQDLGAQRAAPLLRPEAGSRVLDACAAPGGKAAHLLEQCADLRLVAQDIDPLRCRKIGDNLARLGLAAEAIRSADASRLAHDADGKAEIFDAILADVPCSASGVARRFPDTKWLRREEDVMRFARAQARILASLWQSLRPGGKLLYATCSVFPEENQAQIRRFLAKTGDAALSHEEQWLPDGEHDGFYYALLQKRPG